jgi:N-acetylglutamate synthase-like GNAT family acetyltransferase
MPEQSKDFQLAPATQEDFPAIRRLIHMVQINPTGLDWRRFWVARIDDGQIIGCGQVKPHRDGTLELASIATVPEYRNQGIAGTMILHLIEAYPGALYLTCRSGLGRFYERFGFMVVGPDEMPSYFKRISQLASVLMKVGRTGETLLVMKRG